MAEFNERRSSTFGAAALVAGLLSLFGSGMIYATSVWIDPPGWVRIPSMAAFPLGGQHGQRPYSTCGEPLHLEGLPQGP